MKIGIPRALFYYSFFPLWYGFFKSLGHEVIVSDPTNKKIVEEGCKLCVDDACLPVKICYGHLKNLENKVDVIFLPRIISIAPKEYICPKFLGLPDMIKVNMPDLPPIIDTDINLYRKKSKLYEHFLKTGMMLGANNSKILRAFNVAKKYQQHFENYLIAQQMLVSDYYYEILDQKDLKPVKPPLNGQKVLILGHPYNIHDCYINMDLLTKLKKANITPITYEMIQPDCIQKGASLLPKKMFWSLGQKVLGFAYYYLDYKKFDGIIHIASFGCGPDSLIGELLERKIMKDYSVPFLYLNLDEHSGQAGFDTRIEAFIDILEGRRYSENHVPSYG